MKILNTGIAYKIEFILGSNVIISKKISKMLQPQNVF